MTQVCPQECPCPVVCGEEQPATQECGDVEECPEDRRTFRKFASFCDEESQDQEDAGGDKTRRRSRRSNDSSRSRRSNEGRKSPAEPPPYYGHPPRLTDPVITGHPQKDPRKPPFCQCDGIAALGSVAYLFALLILAGALYYFIEDARWNDIVLRRTPFPPNSLEGESFFSGSYLYMYENADPHLSKAKDLMMRENRWLELAHIVYFSSFLLFTFMQLGTYVTRGVEDHSRIVICYYSIFGGLGIIVSLFPLLSWNTQESYYQMTADSLRKFVSSAHADPNSMKTNLGVTNATAADAEILAKVMDFCKEASQDYSLSPSTKQLELFKYNYTLSDFQTLGLCTHYKLKISTALLSFAFAFLCCAIPCVYCFGGNSGDGRMSKGKSARGKAPFQPQQQPLKPAIKPDRNSQSHQQHHHRQSHRHSKAHQIIIDELKKFKQYVEGDSDEQGLHHLHPDNL